MLLRPAGPMAIGLLALACAQGCAARGPVRPAAPQSVIGTTVEARDSALATALLGVALRPSPAAHRAVAVEYRRLRIDDQAFDHLRAATRLDPRDAAAYDGMARIWRDWGFADLGLPDATRAVYFAPRSAAARNTRGTLLAAVGQRDAARRDFTAALVLDPEAAFAATNLCRLDATAHTENVDDCTAQTVARARIVPAVTGK